MFNSELLFAKVNLDIPTVFLIFSIAAIAVFRLLRPQSAVLLVLLGGWVFLPVGRYPPGSAEAIFPFWIIGLATPSDMLLTKAWLAPFAALLGAAVFDAKTFFAFRPRRVDVPMLAWCLWPILQSVFVESNAHPSALVAATYLVGSWGLPWWLARIYFCAAESQWAMLRALTYSALACLSFSVLEAAVGPTVYGWFYGSHPFRADGAERYLGFRPIGFFEHGNQHGIWVSLCTLVAVWCFLVRPSGRSRKVAAGIAVIAMAMSITAQSVGALLLFAAGGLLLFSARFLRTRQVVFGTLSALVLSTLIYTSGWIPISQIGKNTVWGQSVVSAFKAAGRGSFTWRISQDQKLLPEIKAHPVVGSAQWDWWRVKNTRPWGLAMLLLGQFGAVGLMLCFGSVLWPALRAFWRAPLASAWTLEAMPLLLATVIVLAMLDALMNSFIFFPAILLAGSLAGRRQPAH